MSTAFMVRAGRGGYVIDDFKEKSCVAVGWRQLGDLSGVTSRDELAKLYTKSYPEDKPGQIRAGLGQISRFRFDMRKGDPVITYDSGSREYLVGEVVSDYKYEEGRVENHSHIREVKWTGSVNRDDLSVSSRNTLGAIQTIFDVGPEVWEEMNLLLSGEKIQDKEPPETEEEELEQILKDAIGRSYEFIKDKILKLDWDEMQELVAGIVRAMGYKTRVSPPGADRGKDIVASPDGLCLESPRVRVEVKHRPKDSIGASEIRSFIGGLRQSFSGLYVSTGGFTKEAKYEAERATIPVTLLDMDDLVSLLIQHYEDLDSDTRALIPLRRIYWPAE